MFQNLKSNIVWTLKNRLDWTGWNLELKLGPILNDRNSYTEVQFRIKKYFKWMNIRIRTSKSIIERNSEATWTGLNLCLFHAEANQIDTNFVRVDL